MRAGIFVLATVLFLTWTNTVFAENVKIGVMNVQKVLAESAVGKEAKDKVEDKIKSLQDKFKAEEDGLAKLQEEIEKKSSAWSKETKDEKIREFKKQRRELQAKSEDARFEVKQLQEKELGPILKSLEKIVEEYGDKNGFAAILDSKSGVIYYNKTVDVSNDIIKALNASTSK